MKTIFKYIIYSSLFVGCNGEKTAIPVINIDKSIQVDVTYQKCCETIFISPPNQIEMIDSSLILLRPGGCAALEIDLKSGKNLGPILYSGRGENEYISPYFAGQNDIDSTFTIYDIATGSFGKYKWERENDGLKIELISQSKKKVDEYPISNTILLDNGYSFSFTFGNADSALVFYDKDRVPLKELCNPFRTKLESLMTLTGHFATNNNRVVYAMQEIGYICSYVVSNDGNVEKDWEYMAQSLITPDNLTTKNIKESNPLGFYDVKMTDDFIYALYSGKYYIPKSLDNLPKEVIVFSHNGDLVAKIKFDCLIGRFVVANDNKTIYSYDHNIESVIKLDISRVIDKL